MTPRTERRSARRRLFVGPTLKSWGNSFWIALAVGAIVSALVGVIAGLIAIRSRGVYFG